MDSLDFNSLCNIGSFLDFDDFEHFVSACRAFAACRHDLRTLATVVENSAQYDRRHLVFTHLGPSAIRFFVDKCVKSMTDACLSAIWTALDENDDLALSIVAPLCDRSDVQTVLYYCKSMAPMMMEALRFLDVPPDLHADLRKEAPKKSHMSEEAFDAIYRFNRTGEFPSRLSDFVKFADRIFSWDHTGPFDRLVSTLEETDADGSLKIENVDRVVALLETLRNNSGLSEFFERIGFMYEREMECGRGEHLRPYGDIYRRLFAIAPRPLTLKQQLDMLHVCLVCCYFDQVEALYSDSKEEAQALMPYSSCCYNEFKCEDAREAERLREKFTTRAARE